MIIKWTYKNLTTCNWYAYLKIFLREKRVLLVPYKNTHIRIHKESSLEGSGQLSLGIQWDQGMYLPSQLVMRSGSNVTINGEFKIYSGHNIWVNNNSSLILGSGYINNNLNLSCFNKIEIGHNVAISENVTIRDSDNHTLNGSQVSGSISIGDNVWIGMNVTILKGVSIGSGAVIAAGSLVNQDVPAKCLVAGVPAKVKKKEVSWN